MLDYLADGKRIQKVFGSATTEEGLALLEAEAKKEAARIEVQIIDGKHRPKIGLKPIDLLLVEFQKQVDASKRKPATKQAYRYALEVFRKFIDTTDAKRLIDITPELVIAFIQWQDGKSPDTIRLAVSSLQKALSWAMDRGDLLTNPCTHPDVREVKPHGRQHERVFTDAQFEALIEAVHKSKSRMASDLADFFTLLGHTGLRKTEALMLRWCDVSLGADSYLRVQPHDGWSPKTKTSIRRVPLSPRVDAMLRARIRACGTFAPTANVFPAELRGATLQDNFTIALRRAKLDGPDPETGQRLRIHSLRHYFATRLIRSGVDPATVRDLLGQSNIAVTNRYLNTPRSALFGAISTAFKDSDRGVSRHENVTEMARFERFSSEKAGNSGQKTVGV